MVGVYAAGWPQSAEAGPHIVAGAVHAFARNQRVFAEGDDATAYFKVVTGLVVASHLRTNGRRQVECFHGPGDVFGFECGGSRTVSATASCATSIIIYRHGTLDTLASRNEAISRWLLAEAVRTLAKARDHAVLLGRCTALERVARFLVGVADDAPEPDVLTLDMTRLDIADYLGMTVETVSRVLARLESSAIIEIRTARCIRLAKPVALRKLAS
jgi:CRP/FNR family nitrogen fixation transcriptional regulator